MSGAKHWAQIEEASFSLGMWFLFQVNRFLGRWPFRLCLYPVVIYYWATQPRARAASRAYLERAQARFGLKKLSTLQHFLSFAEGIMDKLLAWSGGIDMKKVEVNGWDKACEAIASGRGGIIVTAHLGNLELSRVVSKGHETLKMNILTHTRHAASFNRMMGKLNPNSQVNLIQVTEITPATAIMLSERIAAGEFIIIAGDRVPVSAGSAVVMADFLGDKAPFPAGPWILANLLKCPVFLLWSIRVGDRYWIQFEPFREEIRLSRKQRGADAQALAAEYALRIEDVCRRSPYQWFNFFDFWAIPANMPYNVLA